MLATGTVQRLDLDSQLVIADILLGLGKANTRLENPHIEAETAALHRDPPQGVPASPQPLTSLVRGSSTISVHYSTTSTSEQATYQLLLGRKLPNTVYNDLGQLCL